LPAGSIVLTLYAASPERPTPTPDRVRRRRISRISCQNVEWVPLLAKNECGTPLTMRCRENITDRSDYDIGLIKGNVMTATFGHDLLADTR
jgi:hypothetical protein